MEINGDFDGTNGAAWDRVGDGHTSMEEREVDLSSIELDISNPR
jgi:hypothetical protein